MPMKNIQFDDLLKQKGIQYHIAEKNEYASKNILVTFPDKDIKRTDVQELIEIINVLVDAKPKVNLKNGDLVYLVITVDNRKPADNEQYLLYRQPEEGIAKAKFLDIDELRELVIGANN